MIGSVFTAIKNGRPAQDVYSDFSAEVIARNKMTIILRWGNQDFHRSVLTGPVDLDVWVHQPKETGSDFHAVNGVLNEIDDIIDNLTATAGSDGMSVTVADKVGSSRPLEDTGFNTICRYHSYRILARKVV